MGTDGKRVTIPLTRGGMNAPEAHMMRNRKWRQVAVGKQFPADTTIIQRICPGTQAPANQTVSGLKPAPICAFMQGSAIRTNVYSPQAVIKTIIVQPRHSRTAVDQGVHFLRLSFFPSQCSVSIPVVYLTYAKRVLFAVILVPATGSRQPRLLTTTHGIPQVKVVFLAWITSRIIFLSLWKTNACVR